MSSDQCKCDPQHAEHAWRSDDWTDASVAVIVQINQRAFAAESTLEDGFSRAAGLAHNKRFGVEARARRAAGDRTGDVSLAPKLMLEGGTA